MKLLKTLYIQVLIGIILGGLVGWLYPSFAPSAKIISETFLNMIKMVITPVIFFTVVLGITGAGSLKKAGRIGGKAIIYFEIVTTLALIVGLIVVNVIKPGVGVHAASDNAAELAKISKDAHDMNWAGFFSNIIPENVVAAFAKGDVLQVLFFSILFGIGMKWLSSEGDSLRVNFEKINKVLFNILKIVVRFSPVGAFGGMAFTIGKYGFESLSNLGQLLLCFYITGLIFIFVLLNLVARYYKFSLWKLLVYIKDEILIVLGASSSESALPLLIRKLVDAGCDKEVVGLVVPTGYSFNLDGTSIYLSMGVLFVAQVGGVDLSIGQQLTIIGILLLTSKGAAGIAGSGLIVLASTLAAIKVIPLEGMALLIGVDRFMSEGRAIFNFIGNAVATVVIAKSEKAVDEGVYKLKVES